MKAMQKGMHGRFDEVGKRFDALENHLGEFKFLIENLNEDYKEATASVIKDFKNLTEQEIGTAAENQQLIEKMLRIIEQNENLNTNQKEKVTQKLNDSSVELKHKLYFGFPDIINFVSPISYKAELSIANKQKLPRTWKELKALFLES